MADVIGADLRLLLLADNWQFLLNPAYRRTHMLPFPVLLGAMVLDPLLSLYPTSRPCTSLGAWLARGCGWRV